VPLAIEPDPDSNGEPVVGISATRIVVSESRESRVS
jgi:hypothetical protein